MFALHRLTYPANLPRALDRINSCWHGWFQRHLTHCPTPVYLTIIMIFVVLAWPNQRRRSPEDTTQRLHADPLIRFLAAATESTALLVQLVVLLRP
jgi:hypothetical protein